MKIILSKIDEKFYLVYDLETQNKYYLNSDEVLSMKNILGVFNN